MPEQLKDFDIWAQFLATFWVAAPIVWIVWSSYRKNKKEEQPASVNMGAGVSDKLILSTTVADAGAIRDMTAAIQENTHTIKLNGLDTRAKMDGLAHSNQLLTQAVEDNTEARGRGAISQDELIALLRKLG